ncbi:MAG: aminotransferase class I/II-fold pyridoxal phosphate-dependent enzyme [Pseudomonadales bacterium]
MSLSQEKLGTLQNTLEAQHKAYCLKGLNLDLTRGKPSADQLDLSKELDGILNGNYTMDGTDLRNYGGLDGLPSAKTLFAPVIDVTTDEILIGGNSSLTLMHQTMTFCHLFGLNGDESAWASEGDIKFICPVPGYDRHFSVCQHLGIEMITVPLLADGPDMDQVEALISADPLIKGIWCVPRFSNPTGCVYSDETVERLAALGNIAGPNFKVFYDNAYAVHILEPDAPQLASLMAACRQQGTEDSVFIFGSTSKITQAGAGVAFMGSSKLNLVALEQHIAMLSIGPDKVNQARHVRFLKDQANLSRLMNQHAALLMPRFSAVLCGLEEELGDSGIGDWLSPKGGYFISFNTLPGLAKAVIALAAEAGVKLTPAGATYPYGDDPEDRNIRLAPSVPTVDDITQATAVFINCVRLATVKKLRD